ncbi:hypothetical protein Hanom_Chr04g00312391 [Helianthus anomalus]
MKRYSDRKNLAKKKNFLKEVKGIMMLKEQGHPPPPPPHLPNENRKRTIDHFLDLKYIA